MTTFTFKKILIWILVFTCNASVIAEWSTTYAEDESSLLNTSLNIKWASLIEKYLNKYINELESFKDIYWIENDIIIDDAIKNCQFMISSLRRIQNERIDKTVAEETMSETIARIKYLNKNLKIYLKNKSEQIKEDTSTLKWKYEPSIKIFTNKLNLFVNWLKRRITKDGIISEDDKMVIEHLSLLQKEYAKLSEFKNTPFKNPDELKDTVKTIISEIKWHIKEIKELIN